MASFFWWNRVRVQFDSDSASSQGLGYRNDDRTRRHSAAQERTLALLDATSAVFAPSEFDKMLSFMGGRVLVYYTISGGTISFGVQAQATGWVGISLNKAHQRAGSDMWVASIQSGTPLINDAWSVGRAYRRCNNCVFFLVVLLLSPSLKRWTVTSITLARMASSCGCCYYFSLLVHQIPTTIAWSFVLFLL